MAQIKYVNKSNKIKACTLIITLTAAIMEGKNWREKHECGYDSDLLGECLVKQKQRKNC